MFAALKDDLNRLGKCGPGLFTTSDWVTAFARYSRISR